MRPTRVTFLGTGACGGTPGRGLSLRRESSLLAEHAGTTLLIDVTRHFRAQAMGLHRIDAVLLTHAHRDAAGGIGQLRAWCFEQAAAPIPVYAEAATHRVVARRFARLDHLVPVDVRAGQRCRIGPWSISATAVPHAGAPAFPTVAWRLAAARTVIVYASDVARLTPALERFARGATLLVIDGAMWRRPLFTHLTIDAALPDLCHWRVGDIALTQIGRTAPPHPQLAREVRALCRRAFPAHDGLTLELAPERAPMVTRRVVRSTAERTDASRAPRRSGTRA